MYNTISYTKINLEPVTIFFNISLWFSNVNNKSCIPGATNSLQIPIFNIYDTYANAAYVD